MITRELEQIMKIDSTSGKEAELARFMAEHFMAPGADLEIQDVGDGAINLFYKWGKPEIIFCSHLDTVPPYIAPASGDGQVSGRGACDAKGQIITAWNVCRELYNEGENNFGLLLVSGEETGSTGARVANNLIKGCRYVIIGEPTENKLIKAGKGIQLYDVQIRGTSCHSGYPQFGDDAVERMRQFLNRLAAADFPSDPVLGSTTYNIGQLQSENAYNVLPDLVRFKIYFRTTHASYQLTEDILKGLSDEKTTITKIREDKPFLYHYIDGFECDIVAFGCDGPCLTNLGKCLLYGPGSIKVAHTEDEYINVSEIDKAITDLKKIYHTLKKGI
ncbi:MAG: M20/M25/M40 family metallo-hydrolase [Bacteroidales bacterium]|jgi:acetylornithine deacetylase|nr:M20/M25/M40 family metallo-hydrolase [Bacteroidales bacterium]